MQININRKVFGFVGRLYRKEKMLYITKNGFILCGFGWQITLHNFDFFNQMDKKFNGEY